MMEGDQIKVDEKGTQNGNKGNIQPMKIRDI
jgi:hypothetical protein